MAINLSSGQESLFARWGKFIGGINEASDWQGEYTNDRAVVIASSFNVTNRNVIDNLYSNVTSQNSSSTAWVNSLSQYCTDTVIAMGLADIPPIPSADIQTALIKVRDQMASTSQSIARPFVTSLVTANGSNTGNGICVTSTTDAIDGTVNPYVHQETVVVTCTGDGYPGGTATEGREPFSVIGEIATASNLSWNWPAGSGANTTISVTDPAQTGGVVTNGSFDTWPSATAAPTGWTVSTGTLGTTVVRGVATYRGAYNLRFVGNGSELSALRQVVTLAPNTVYAINCWTRTDGSVAAGVLNIRLLNDSFSVISDNAGNAISFSQNANSLTSSYAAFTNWILTPAVLPDSLTLEVRLSTALTSTEYLDIDDLQIVQATRIYTGGPYLAMFAGSTPFAVDDSFSIAYTNSLGVNSFARGLDRVFNLKNLGIKFPTSNSPTISSSLIV